MQTEIEIISDNVELKFPQLTAIMDAISAYREGRGKKAACPVCRHVLIVTDLPEINSLWVTCGTGCTSYHQRYKSAVEAF